MVGDLVEFCLFPSCVVLTVIAVRFALLAGLVGLIVVCCFAWVS